MAFLNKFLDAVKVNDDFDDDEEFLDDEDEEFEDEKPRKRFFKKLDEEDDDLDDLPPVKSSRKAEKKAEKQKAERQAAAAKAPKQSKTVSSPKVTPIYSARKKTAAAVSSEVCVIKPKKFDESLEIVDALLDNCTVILNLEGLDVTLAQHIIDFIAGASYSVDGSLQKVSTYIFILTPEGVDITGDSQEILNDIAGSSSMYEGL